MGRFLTFDELVTPTIISVVYWLGILFIVLGGLSTLAGGFWAFLFGLLGAALGVVFWRVACEMMLVLFRIHDQLGELVRLNTAASLMSPAPASRP